VKGQDILDKPRYERARTIRERGRRLGLGAVLGIATFAILIPVLALFWLTKNPSHVTNMLVTVALVGVPVGIGIAAELRVGRTRSKGQVSVKHSSDGTAKSSDLHPH
jgi:hypothetical protein